MTSREYEITRFRRWIEKRNGISLPDYHALWQWSVTELNTYWENVWEYFEIQSATPYEKALNVEQMPGALWFSGARVNYAQQVLRHAGAAEAIGLPAIVFGDETGFFQEIGWKRLRDDVAALALYLKGLGVEPGDRVVAYMPNLPATTIALLATASIGAVWSVCPPDMGVDAIIDRFSQIGPKVLIACNGSLYGGKIYDRTDTVRALRNALPTLENTISYTYPGVSNAIPESSDFNDIVSRRNAETQAFTPQPVDFSHPLWIVYSSGTTGLPKALVQGHGGVMLVSLIQNATSRDLSASYRPDAPNDRFFYYCSTGWALWNIHVSALLNGTTICIYDGSPNGTKAAPDWGRLWRFAARSKATFFGAGAPFYAGCHKAGIRLADCGVLTSVRTLASTGSPLAKEDQAWGAEEFSLIGVPNIQWFNASGGTDLMASFVAGCAELPPVETGMQCRALGVSVEAWDEKGNPLIDEVGELVCTRPVPSMPLFLWGDTDGRRYHNSYFDVYPGIWRHGDWLEVKSDGSCVIYGRSDATINRRGHRIGSGELYRAIEPLPEIEKSIVVDLEFLERPSFMPLFVVLREGLVLDEALKEKLRSTIANQVSPRFVPDEIFAVPDVPTTLSGKKQEVPLKKMLLGQPVDTVFNPDAMMNPECLEWYDAFSKSFQQSELHG
ncbi:acetoacetate--CoA ligase [Pusillimonas sp. TS35]|nr:acetoacetate--CoA ligase [Pusillimonas sp. TS35]